MCCSRAETIKAAVVSRPVDPMRSTPTTRLTLQSQPVRLFTPRVPAHTNQPTGHLPLQSLGTRKERRVRSTISNRYSKPRRVSENDIRSPFTRGFEHGQCQKIGRGDHLDPMRLGLGREGMPVRDSSMNIRVLNHDAETTLPGLFDGILQLAILDHRDRNPKPFASSPQDGQRLRADVLRDDKHLVLDVGRGRLGRGRQAHGHGFRSSGSLVQQGSVGDGQTGEGGDDGLVVDERLEPTLRLLWAVWRVRGVPGGVLEQLYDEAEQFVTARSALIFCFSR